MPWRVDHLPLIKEVAYFIHVQPDGELHLFSQAPTTAQKVSIPTPPPPPPPLPPPCTWYRNLHGLRASITRILDLSPISFMSSCVGLLVACQVKQKSVCQHINHFNRDTVRDMLHAILQTMLCVLYGFDIWWFKISLDCVCLFLSHYFVVLHFVESMIHFHRDAWY